MSMLGPSADEIASARAVATRVATRLVPASSVEDVVQEALARLLVEWKRVATYAPPWIVRVTTNLAIAELRRAGRPPAAIVASEATEQRELRLDLDVAVRALPTRQRQVVTLRYLADLDEATVADLLGCSRGAVKRHLHRALTALRVSPQLAHHEEPRMPHWTEHFVEATEPVGGWPPRPWDHRLVHEAGTWDRVAVDANGDIILDADGDEVMSGPGFGHAVVKVTSEFDLGDPEPRPVTRDPDVDRLLDAAAEVAQHFGHPWVGPEHLALALADRGALPGVDGAVLRRRVAAFYEGPFAQARLVEVDRRARGGAFSRPDPSLLFWNRSLRDAVDGRDLAGIAAAVLSTDGHSLVRTLLDG